MATGTSDAGRHIAAHEAGHVVVAVLLGATGVRASITPSTLEGDFHCDSLTATPLGWAMVDLGGLLGGLLAGDPLAWESSQDDFRQAAEELGDVPNPERVMAGLLAHMLEVAEKTPGFRAAVDAVALALVERGRLDDAEIRAAMAGAVAEMVSP